MALGKNLENILGDYFGEETVKLNTLETKKDQISSNSLEIEIAKIKSNPHQTRKFFEPEKIESLAKSIKRSGLLNPITIFEEKNGTYTLLAGERRLRAFKLLGRKTIPAIVKRDENLTEDEQFVISSSENLHRENLNALELAKTFEILLKKDSITIEKLAKTLGTSNQYVQNYLNLLKLAKPVQNALAEGRIGEGQARQLVPHDEETQIRVLPIIIEKGLSVREIMALLRSENKVKRAIEWSHSLSAVKMQMVKNLSSQFEKSEVKCKGNDKKGKIVITWG